MKFYAGFAFLTTLAREIVKDIEDKDGDDAFDIHTLAVDYGNTVAKIVASAVLLVLLCASLYFIEGFIEVKAKVEIAYLTLVVALPVLIALVMLALAKKQKDYARISLLLKMIMLLGILSIAVFYLSNHS
jgi:4-hydroxybenzoate polyprenyltransferase